MKVFLAGIMQGSLQHEAMHDQDYRRRLKDHLIDGLPDAVVYDPLADHGNSLEYEHHEGRDVFLMHNRMCREVDAVIAFVPEASMGTAIEMWEASQNGVAVITISPLSHNWAVRYCSHAVYEDLREFTAALESGEVLRRIVEIRQQSS